MHLSVGLSSLKIKSKQNLKRFAIVHLQFATAQDLDGSIILKLMRSGLMQICGQFVLV